MADIEGIVLVLTHDDTPYIPRLLPLLKGLPYRVITKSFETLSELTVPLKKAGVSHVATTSPNLLKKLIVGGKGSIDNYAGSIIESNGIEFLFINPLKQLVTVPYGEFLAARYLSKFLTPEKWPETSSLEWKEINNEQDYQEALQWLGGSDLIGVDIETVKNPSPAITLSGYCGLHLETNESKAFVLSIKSMEAVYKMRELNRIPVPKVLQNGKYDNAYFFMYNAPLAWWYFDTANMLHAWYSELPKDLGSVSAFFIRNSIYWKDLAGTEPVKYNALDCWSTVDSAVAWIKEAPDWARKNYIHKFPMNFPSHMCEMRGIKRDPEKLKTANEQVEQEQEKILKSLQAASGTPKFNPSSPKQVLALMKILGHKNIKETGEQILQEESLKHPLSAWFVERILEYRGLRKLSSTYLKSGVNASEYKGRILYSINPHGTDTGRNSSNTHHFWCGLQIQNIPRSGPVKPTLVADEGFEIWEADYSQAEDRGVAYKSGDPALLEIFSSGLDSHTVKASMFFGMPYEEITPELRVLAKRINHGSNYNMRENTLYQTMGSVLVMKAKRLLNLNKNMSPIAVCKHLLKLYEIRFKVVKGDYYNAIKREILKTHKLTGDTGWTRYCFGDPFKSRQALNAYIAHVTQSLSAMILDNAFLSVFKELGFDPDFKLLAQIHDSILFQVRIGRENLPQRVKDIMSVPYNVTDCFGDTRKLLLPVDLKCFGSSWGGSDE